MVVEEEEAMEVEEKEAPDGTRERERISRLFARCPDTFLQRGLVRQEKRHVSRHHVHTSSLRGHRYAGILLSFSISVDLSLLPSHAFYIVAHLWYHAVLSLSLSFSRLFRLSPRHGHGEISIPLGARESRRYYTYHLAATRRCLSATAVN